MILMLLPSAPAQEKASNPATLPPKYLTPLKDPLVKPEAGASSELILSRDSGKDTDPILRVYGDYPSTAGSLGRLMGDRKAPGYKDPEGKVIALEVLKNGDVLFGPNTGIARRPANDKDPNSRLETDPQHTSPIDFYWDAQDRKLHVRSILLTENGDPADLGFRRSGDETYPYGPPVAIRAGASLGAMYWMGWGAKGHGFNDRAAQIYARSAEDITDKAAGGKLHFATTPLGTTRPVDRLVISSEGQVGIGATHPQASLHLADGHGGMAEDYPATEKLEAGDVVAIDENAKTLTIARATQAYDQKLVGVVVSNPTVRISQLKGTTAAGADANLVEGFPVAHGGRVIVKVSSESGPIRPGDYLTSSSTPGGAMKATAKGAVVGKALESYSQATAGKIKVLLDVTWYVP